MSDTKKRYVGPSGAVFVPGGRVDDVTISDKVKAGEWRLATDAEVSKFLGAHPPQEPKAQEPSQRGRRRAAADEE